MATMITVPDLPAPTRSVQEIGRTAQRAAGPLGGWGGWMVTGLATLSIAGVSLLFLAVPRQETVITLGLLVLAIFCMLRWPVTVIYMSVGCALLVDAYASPYVHTFISDMAFYANLSNIGL